MYNVNIPVIVPENGALSSGNQMLCIFVVIYLGTLSIVMFVNFIPSLVVLNFRPWIYLSILSISFLGSVLGFVLSLYFLIEPQKTFDSSTVVGSGNDPILASIGTFFCFGFAFLAILCGGIITTALGKPSLTSILYRLLPIRVRAWSWRVIGSVALFTLLGWVSVWERRIVLKIWRCNWHNRRTHAYARIRLDRHNYKKTTHGNQV